MKRDAALHPLSWEHHSALTAIVFVRRQILAGADAKQLETMAREFVEFHRDALIPHFRHEEEWLLPRLIGHLSVEDDLVVGTLKDHVAIHRLVWDLDASRKEPGKLADALTKLVDRLESHIRFEEREVFVRTEACLSQDELDQLGRQLHGADMPAVVLPGSDGQPLRPGPKGTEPK